MAEFFWKNFILIIGLLLVVGIPLAAFVGKKIGRKDLGVKAFYITFYLMAVAAIFRGIEIYIKQGYQLEKDGNAASPALIIVGVLFIILGLYFSLKK